MSWRIEHSDCVEAMRELPESSINAIVCDPPYGIRFMGKAWDGADIEAQLERDNKSLDGRRGNGKSLPQGQQSPAAAAGTYDVSLKGNLAFQEWSRTWATEALRILKPGGHLLAFGGTRTYHRLACAVEDAGFEIRDSLIWLYGSGFPKSLNLDGEHEGWGTALKPAHEPIVVARKPLAGTVAQNVTEYGTGALNINGCRIQTDDDLNGGAYSEDRKPSDSEWVKHGGTIHNSTGEEYEQPSGRWPANAIFSPEAAAELDEQSGDRKAGGSLSGTEPSRTGGDGTVAYGEFKDRREWDSYGDTGGASRFFYCAKASRGERNAGLDASSTPLLSEGATPQNAEDADWSTRNGNHHPTVKPIDLMRWLVRLVTPPGGTVLDPFTGSGTTGLAAVLEGFDFVGIEREAEYVSIASARVAWWAERAGRSTAAILTREGIRQERERQLETFRRTQTSLFEDS